MNNQEYTMQIVGRNLVCHEKKLKGAYLRFEGGGVKIYSKGQFDYGRMIYHARVILPIGTYLQLRYVGSKGKAPKKTNDKQMKLL